MNIAIFGDSFANGETDMGNYLAHYGLTQYLTDDGHFAINFSRQGNSNSSALIDYRVAMRQNEHIEWDMAIVFQTELVRDGSSWVTYIVGDDKQEPISVRDVETTQLKEFYCNLKKSQDIYKTPIYLVGGTADTLSPEVVEECGLKCACQSLVNLCVNGDHLIEDVEVEIGGQRIDKHYREWNQIWSELTIPKSKQEGFQYLTGSFNNNNLPTSKQQTIMYPLNFWFCRNPGLALPLIALQYHDVQLKITWGTAKYDSTSNENLTRINTSSPVTIPVEIWGDYIYLDTDERRRFAQVSHEYLIEQVQIQKEKDDNKLVYTLNLEHPVKELIWTNPSSNPMTNQKAKNNPCGSRDKKLHMNNFQVSYFGHRHKCIHTNEIVFREVMKG